MVADAFSTVWPMMLHWWNGLRHPATSVYLTGDPLCNVGRLLHA